MAKDNRDLGFRCVEPEDGVILAWADPTSIRKNAGNPIDHPAAQTEAVQESIEKHGWILPLVFNLTTRRLVDGHDRLQIAIANGRQAVPVWVGSWPEEDEPEVILLLRETGGMARWNPERTEAMIARFGETSAAVKKLIDDLSQREGLVAYRERVAETPTAFSEPKTPPPPDRVGDGDVDPAIQARAMAAEPPSLSASRVRLVQLFIDADKLELFNEWVDDLQEMWGVTSVTDAVLRTLSDAHLAYLRGGRRRRT